MAVVAFGVLLRRYRKAAGLTQEELAERAMLSVFTVSALERGTSTAPRRDTLQLLADALQLAEAERAALAAAAHPHPPGAPGASPPPGTLLPPLIGREAETALLERHLAGEGPAVLVLAGEPGIGKSRLLAEAQARAHAAGWTVLAGGCAPGGGHGVYEPLSSVLEARLAITPRSQALRDLDGCEWLARILPELRELGIEPPVWTLTPAQERRQAVRALTRYLQHLVGPAGALLVLDDLQWADADGLEVLDALVARATDARLRVVAAFRSTELAANDALRAVVARWVSAGTARRREISLLPAGAASELFTALLDGTAVPEADRRDLLQRAGGLPFFLVSCAEELRSSGAHMPQSVMESVRQRLRTLPGTALELLRLAAVVGRTVERGVLLDAQPMRSDAQLDALEAACEAGLLAEDAAASYRFTHDLIREVVLADLSAVRRAALHQRVAELLEARPRAADAATLAYHYARSDQHARAVPYLELAGEEAVAATASSAARAFFAEGVRLADAAGDDAAAARLSARLGLLMVRLFQYSEAIQALQRASDAFARAVHARPESLPDAVEGITVEVYVACAALAISHARYRDCERLAHHAVRMARDAGDQAMVAEALRLEGTAAYKLGRMEHAAATLARAREAAQACGALVILNSIIAQSYFPLNLIGDFTGAAENSALQMENALRIGDDALIARAHTNLAWSSMDTGAWEQAVESFAAAIRLVPALAGDAYMLANQNWILMAQGSWEEADRGLADAAALARRTHNEDCLIMILRWQAELDLLRGRPADALALLLDTLAIPDVHDVVFMLPLLAWSYLALGELEEASREAERALALVHAEHTLIVLPTALRVQGEVLLAQRHWEEARRCLEEGLAASRRMPSPYEEAQLLLVVGQLHVAREDLPAARERFEQALALFRSLGSRWGVARAEELSRQHGAAR